MSQNQKPGVAERTKKKKNRERWEKTCGAETRPGVLKKSVKRKRDCAKPCYKTKFGNSSPKEKKPCDHVNINRPFGKKKREEGTSKCPTDYCGSGGYESAGVNKNENSENSWTTSLPSPRLVITPVGKTP